MLSALKSKSGGRGPVSTTKTIVAPIGGWNARDPIGRMNEIDAITLDNFFPGVASVMNRYGMEAWATGLPSTVETIMTYASTTEKLFAVSGASIYDVTSQGAVGAAVETGLTSAQMKYTNITTAGGSFLYAVNGADKPRLYNGTTWVQVDGASVPAITGVTTSTLSDVVQWKRRLFFTQKNTLSVWYLPVDSVGGAASKIDFGPLFKLGGYIVNVATWTIDGGDGMDDHLVIITNQGEVAVYQGTDPASASSFSLVGVYALGAPVSLKPCTKYAGDLLILTLDGLLPLSKALLSTRTNNRIAISDKIEGALSTATSLYQSNYGWQLHVFPKADMLIVNVPVTTGATGTSVQYVMNTITGAWCSFSGWNAKSFELLNEDLYFGGNQTVYKAWTGTSDNGAPIRCVAKQAYSYFDSPGLDKQWKMARPILNCNLPPTVSLGVNVDYQDSEMPIPLTLSSAAFGVWDTSLWDVGLWAGTQIYKQWRSIKGYGNAASFYLQISSALLMLEWSSTDFIYERGKIGP